jgi:hypothetical protein
MLASVMMFIELLHMFRMSLLDIDTQGCIGEMNHRERMKRERKGRYQCERVI